MPGPNCGCYDLGTNWETVGREVRNVMTFCIGLKHLFESKNGQGMVEYGLIIGLVAIVVVGTLAILGGQLNTIFQNIVTALTGGS
jgi:pilus assembly protein Flp/PilA